MKKTLYALLTTLLLLPALALPCAAESKKPDLDLSAMSGTIVYSQVYNMMTDPTPYLGMVIRVAGYYDAYEDEEAGSVYHACVIPDATACCAQGIEFVWAGEHSYPEDYPEPGPDIVVTGQLETYEEGDYLYLRLGSAEMAEQ